MLFLAKTMSFCYNSLLMAMQELITTSDIIKGISRSSTLHRDFDYYAKNFHYTQENLKGKTILDIGASDSNFAEKASELGANIIRLDGDGFKPSTKENLAMGAVQNLPFENESFDEVIASWSLLWVRVGIEKAFTEMVRVTKRAGQIKVYPIIFGHYLSDSLINYPFMSLERYSNFASTLIINKESTISANDWQNAASDVSKYTSFFFKRRN
jgi:hypothetical protein